MHIMLQLIHLITFAKEKSMLTWHFVLHDLPLTSPYYGGVFWGALYRTNTQQTRTMMPTTMIFKYDAPFNSPRCLELVQSFEVRVIFPARRTLPGKLLFAAGSKFSLSL